MKYQQKWQDWDFKDWIDRKEWHWDTNDRETQLGQNSCKVGGTWSFGAHKSMKGEEICERREVMSILDDCTRGDLKNDHGVSRRSNVIERRDEWRCRGEHVEE